MVQPIIEKSYLVEINLGTVAAGKKINFQYIPQLEGAQIYGIQTFSATDVVLSPNNTAVVANNGLSSIIVNFFVQDNEEIFQMPISDLRSPNISGFVRLFNNKKINLTKSFITILATTNLVNNDSVLFQFLYKNSK